MGECWTRYLPSLVIGTWSLVFLTAVCEHAIAQPPQTGPDTEKRFPPLVVPDGFQATLFACDPLIEYPSAIAVGPKEKPGSLFVAIDYMTGLGTEIVRRDEIRLVEDTDGNGYADKATVYADGFNSIMGLTYHGGTVYVMHSPLLTALKDTNGDGQADERRDLLSGLGLPPEENDVRLHCANGTVMGHDGWLYLALGDHGCDVPRPEGDRLVYHGGSILRCRPDGADLHLFASGLRNIYDVALDDDLNVFVRDNENDGGDYKIRVCYSFHGADHGYPYLYYERPEEALPPLADLGLGSSAGGAAYLERQFPAEYHGSLFFCEWGRAVVNYRPQRSGSGFSPLAEIQFAAGAENDPYGFKPTDLIVDRDGSLVVADWCDGQRPKRGRGRIYRITHGRTGFQPVQKQSPLRLDEWITQLDASSHFERFEAQDALSARGPEGLQAVLEALDAESRLGTLARMHAAWILARDGSQAAREKLFEMAERDADPRVQIQAVRALADLYDPVLAGDRLDASPADPAIAQRLAKLAAGKDPCLLLEIVIGVGRLQWAAAPQWLASTLGERLAIEPILAHAAMQTLRRSDNWPAVLRLLDAEENEPLRQMALRAVAGQYEPQVVQGLIARLESGTADRRREYADALARVCKRPGPWTYWGYRPPPRPAAEVPWEQTAAIEQSLARLLADEDRDVRLAVLRRMQREKIAAPLKELSAWLGHERDQEAVAAILASLSSQPADRRRPLLMQLVADRQQATVNRLQGLRLLRADLSANGAGELRGLIAAVEDGPVLAELLGPWRAAAGNEAIALLTQKLQSPSAEVRAAAIDALASAGDVAAAGPIAALLRDGDPLVRRSAALAAGELGMDSAAAPLLELAGDADVQVRCAALESLGKLGTADAAPLAAAALTDRRTQAAALACLAATGGPEHAPAVIRLAEDTPPETIAVLAVTALATWRDDRAVTAAARAEMEAAIQKLQGGSGLVVLWHVSPPLAGQPLEEARQRLLASKARSDSSSAADSWQTAVAAGSETRIELTGASGVEPSWLTWADVSLQEASAVQFLAAADGLFQVWINGREAYRRQQPRGFAPYSDVFDAPLPAGASRIVLQVTSSAEKPQFHLRFRRKSSTARHEQFLRAALEKSGDGERGRRLFLNADRTQCIKCHRVGSDGERIGPELTGLGDRFSRIHIVESILEPSRTVAPGYQTLLVRLADGQTISGIKTAEDDRTLTLADSKGNKHTLAKSEIEVLQPQTQSTMPDNLIQPLTADEFVDLVAFLASQKRTLKPQTEASP